MGYGKFLVILIMIILSLSFICWVIPVLEKAIIKKILGYIPEEWEDDDGDDY